MDSRNDSAEATDRGLLRVLTCGSVDDGKSTLMGRLLFDLNLIPADEMTALERDSCRSGKDDAEPDLSLLFDGLEAEQDQGITIDVAYRYFQTARRSFIVADAPGHLEEEPARRGRSADVSARIDGGEMNGAAGGRLAQIVPAELVDENNLDVAALRIELLDALVIRGLTVGKIRQAFAMHDGPVVMLLHAFDVIAAARGHFGGEREEDRCFTLGAQKFFHVLQHAQIAP